MDTRDARKRLSEEVMAGLAPVVVAVEGSVVLEGVGLEP